MSGKEKFIEFVLNNAHSPMAILGAAVSFVKVSSPEGRRIADAVDATIRREIEAMKRERS